MASLIVASMGEWIKAAAEVTRPNGVNIRLTKRAIPGRGSKRIDGECIRRHGGDRYQFSVYTCRPMMSLKEGSPREKSGAPAAKRAVPNNGAKMLVALRECVRRDWSGSRMPTAPPCEQPASICHE